MGLFLKAQGVLGLSIFVYLLPYLSVREVGDLSSYFCAVLFFLIYGALTFNPLRMSAFLCRSNTASFNSGLKLSFVPLSDLGHGCYY